MAPTPERWQQIEALYHAAMERGRGVLDGADPELRREVESLLAEAPTGQGLLDQPAAELLAEAATIELKQGARLGPYQIESLIGQGGMGKVYRARDTRLGRTVAIKTSNARFSERFEREARAVAALNHPHICHLYDVGPDYLVMEYIEGTPLKGPFPLDEALKYAEQICDALDAAHQKGIIHRDLKPGNILLTTRGIKLLDFGVAQMKPGADDTDALTMTMTGAVMGTPGYMAPEQWQGKRADARSDIYSFGCVLYEMLTGKRAGRLAAAVSPGAGGSPELDRMLGKCIEEDPDLRYQHAAEIRADLVRLMREIDSKGAAAKGTAGRWKVMVPTAAAVVASLAAGYFYLHRAPALTDKDTIVLADFTNTTGDPVFDGTLRQGLAVQLEQSPFLSMVSEQRIQKALSLMGRSRDTQLSPAIANEVCARTGGAAVLNGSITGLGSQYVLGLRAANCLTGDVFAEEQAQVARKEDVLKALSQMASKFRTRVGESLATVAQHDTPLAEATTASLEALKAYSGALRVQFSSGGAAALPFFRRATEIDPQFAMAHANLGVAYGSIGESDLSVQSTARAYRLRDRTSDWEKFFIGASYARRVTGNLENAQQTCELWAQIYPREALPHDYLETIYQVTGQYDKGVEEGRKAIGFDPDFAFGYALLAGHYRRLDRLSDAESVLRMASERKLEIPDFLVERYDIAFLKGDPAAMEREVALAQGKSAAEDRISEREASVLAYSGHLEQARRKLQIAVELAQQAGHRQRAAVLEIGPALWEAFFGNGPAAALRGREILKLSRDRDVEYGAAFALAISGEIAGAQTLTADLGKRFPEDTAVRFNYLPTLGALLALKRGEPLRAIELLQIAAPYELGGPAIFGGSLYPVYVRGESYLAAHRGPEAAAEFQKVLDHRGIVLSDPIGALAHLQLGRALALSGDKTRAKGAYQDFLTLWKHADPAIPILVQAKAENSRLQ